MIKRKNLTSKDWFNRWFDDPLYLKLYLHRDSKEAKATINMILQTVQELSLGSVSIRNIIDVACGNGRHAVALARKGFSVTANDISDSLREKAKATAIKEGISKITFSCQDMRTLSYNTNFDMAVQLFTSFGYFDSKEEDRQTLHCINNILSRHGWYVLDFFNVDQVNKSLPSEKHVVIDEVNVHETKYREGDFVIKVISVEGKETFIEKVRGYTYQDLSQMLIEAGFSVKKIVGDYQGHNFTAYSPRVIFFSSKR